MSWQRKEEKKTLNYISIHDLEEHIKLNMILQRYLQIIFTPNDRLLRLWTTVKTKLFARESLYIKETVVQTSKNNFTQVVTQLYEDK